ncbi:MAG: LuxR C-terminal-related transcriptional regulator [Desulfobacteraceae bacterium]|jgi:DNA-binding CsgD family transcriptional regulator
MKNSKNCQPCEFRNSLAKDAINSLSANIAIINEEGVILETNKAWQEFAHKTGATGDLSFIGQNYLTLCDQTTGEQAQDAHAVAEGIRSVIRGETQEFLYDYPCHGPEGPHWFYMRSIRVDSDGPLQVIVSHEEITALKLTEEALRKSKADLEAKKNDLEESNIALKVLLRQRDEDKKEMEQKVLTNIKDLVFPYVEKLKRAPLRAKDRTNVEIIEAHLNEVISPLLQNLASLNILLTPQEMQIASLVKDGKTSKEIADVLHVSETTVHFHRKNLRNKFGLKNRSTNLRSYLMSLT